MSTLLTFVNKPQRYPDARDASLRVQDFQEIYERFEAKNAAAQASRCSQCGVPFCQVHCPLGNNIPDWLKLTVEGRLEEAYEVASATNDFPEICGRICPQDRLCEGNCVIEKDFGAVTIGAVEKYITETAFDMGWVKPQIPTRENGRTVGIVGAGPAGLAAATQLRRKGYDVHVYDRYDRIGGLLIYGIPGFKLEKYVVERRRDLLEASGIRFHLNADVGGSIPFTELRHRHETMLIATGVYKARAIDIPDASLAGIVPALAYLTASNRVGLGDCVPDYDNGTLNAAGRHVVVIGGGDTAMDCVRTAVRQGAKHVTCLYRRDRANMPGSAREVKHAEEEGVVFEWMSLPRGFVGHDRVEQILAVRMRLGAAENGGRRVAIPIENSQFALKADLVIQALGFEAEDLTTAFAEPELKISSIGTLAVDDRLMTSLPGVFAAGDIVRGASLVVWGIKDGRDAARHMHEWMNEKVAANVGN